MKLFGKFTVLALLSASFTACSDGKDGNPKFEMTSSKNSQEMYEKSGLPSSDKYNNQVQNLNVNDFKSQTLSQKSKSGVKKK